MAAFDWADALASAPEPKNLSGRRSPEQLRARLDKARRELIACSWSDADLLVSAATLAAELGERGEAVGWLQRALAIDRNHPYARAKLREVATPAELEGMDLPLPSQPLSRDRREPFRYPLRRDGRHMMAIGGVCLTGYFLVIGIALGYGVFGLVLGLPLALLACGYLFAFLCDVVRETAVGRADVPEWRMWDMGLYFLAFKALLLLVAPAAPAMIWWTVALTQTPLPGWASFLSMALLLLAGMFCLPAMLLILVIQRSLLAALSPHVVAATIRQTWREYRLAALIWQATAGASIALTLLGLVTSPIVLALAAGTLPYALAAGGRAVGMVYQSCQEDLGWYA